MNTSKNTSLIIIIFAALIVLGIFFVTKSPKKEEEQVVCTMEAKLCPDGSYVGRSGPACMFAQCPAATSTSGWKTFTDSAQGFTFQYPETLTTKYITTVDWPPKVSISGDPFACTTAGKETDRAGQTTKEIINGRAYCVTKVVEGAAGSMYTQYAYATEIENKVLYFTFTLRATQCANYEPTERTACESERAAFDIDSLVDQIAQTTKFIK